VYLLWRALGGVPGDNLVPLEAYFNAHPDLRPTPYPRARMDRHLITDQGANSVYFYHPQPGELEAIHAAGGGGGPAALMPPPE
jgi:hypothetical protein